MTLVRKTFLVFVAAFVIQISVIALLLGFGYRQSESQWRSVRNQQAYDAARYILLGDLAGMENSEYAGQLMVFDTQRNMIATNRGMGMRGSMNRVLSAAPQMPVYDQGNLIGYYATGNLTFEEDLANRALLSSMFWVLLASLVLSLVISLLAALYFAKKVSSPADRIARSLGKMTDGDLSDPVEANGSEELVRIAASIESLRRRLVHERTVRSQWSQDVAHDLRTPVASVKAQLEGMGDGILAPTKERFERTGRELERMETLIDDLETLMRLESPEAKLNVEALDAATFANDLAQQFEAQMLLKQLTFSRDVQVTSFAGDRFLLSRAVSNLLSNAVRYTDAGGTVSLRMATEQDGVILSVRNSGKPIPPEELPKVFERLYRGEYARTSAGSGLGLTIVERIVRLHGGNVSITSSAAQGTEVAIRLPRSIVGEPQQHQAVVSADGEEVAGR